MSKHRDKGVPSTGTGEAGGHGPKPARTQVAMTNKTGTTLWKGMTGLFSSKKKKSK